MGELRSPAEYLICKQYYIGVKFLSIKNLSTRSGVKYLSTGKNDKDTRLFAFSFVLVQNFYKK